MERIARTSVDASLERKVAEGFAFPLGVAPVGACEPRPGYSMAFESADGGESEGLEEWPDRYVFEAAISAERLEPLCRTLFTLLPGRVYPILDVLGADMYREVDPYIAYDPVGLDTFLSGVRRHQGWLYEDGLVGFGAMAEEPFVYVYLDEHKVLTVRAEIRLRDQIERILQAFDLDEVGSPMGADCAEHEHLCVLQTPTGREDLLGPEEAVEELQDAWRLRLNIDHDANVDDAGRDLGLTGWRCEVRVIDQQRRPRYAEALLLAGSRGQAETMTLEALRELVGETPVLDARTLLADRLAPEMFAEMCGAWGVADGDAQTAGVRAVRWM